MKSFHFTSSEWKNESICFFSPSWQLRYSYFLCSVLLIVGCLTSGADAAETSYLRGVNRVNLAWVPAEQRAEIFHSMIEAGVRSVRLSLTPPFDESVKAMAEARHLGLKVLMVLNLSRAEFNRPEVVARPSYKTIFEARPLSALDPNYFSVVFARLFALIEKQKITLEAVEIGNEINWAAFNGDLPVATTRTAAKDFTGALDVLPERDRFVTGIRNYVEALRLAAFIVRTSRLNQNAQIVAAGLATIPSAFAQNLGSEFVRTSDTIAVLRKFGADDVVDAYAVHFYPNATAPTTAVIASVRDALAPCVNADMRHACWVTEWGLADKTTACPEMIDPRVAAAASVRSVLDELSVKGKVRASFYYDWNGADTPYAIWRCGHLTQSGEIALQDSPLDVHSPPP